MNKDLEIMWRRRLADCQPLALVDTMETNPIMEVRLWAAEALDEKLKMLLAGAGKR